MTGMLASVSSVKEAEVVLQADVDIVDIKNPFTGALGALDVRAVSSIVKMIAGSIPTSATIGDVEQCDSRLPDLIENMAATGVDFVKVGLFAERAETDFIKVIQSMALQGYRIVVVVFAEHYRGGITLLPLLESGVCGVMMDTCSKDGRSLLDIVSPEELTRFVESVRNSHLLAGLAGSLRYEQIKQLLDYKPDYLGFRGALCADDNRINSISAEMVGQIREAIPKQDNIHYDDRRLKLAFS